MFDTRDIDNAARGLSAEQIAKANQELNTDIWRQEVMGHFVGRPSIDGVSSYLRMLGNRHGGKTQEMIWAACTYLDEIERDSGRT